MCGVGGGDVKDLRVNLSLQFLKLSSAQFGVAQNATEGRGPKRTTNACSYAISMTNLASHGGFVLQRF